MVLAGAYKITQIAFRKYVTALVSCYQHRPVREVSLWKGVSGYYLRVSFYVPNQLSKQK